MRRSCIIREGRSFTAQQTGSSFVSLMHLFKQIRLHSTQSRLLWIHNLSFPILLGAISLGLLCGGNGSGRWNLPLSSTCCSQSNTSMFVAPALLQLKVRIEREIWSRQVCTPGRRVRLMNPGYLTCNISVSSSCRSKIFSIGACDQYRAVSTCAQVPTHQDQHPRRVWERTLAGSGAESTRYLLLALTVGPANDSYRNPICCIDTLLIGHGN